MNNLKENQCVKNHGSPRTWSFDISAGANECIPNPVLKIKTSCNYDTILCSKWLGILCCSYFRLKLCPSLDKSELR